ncbi:MAG TPA: peptidase M28, partial [Blastocatellia bacterium]|nr:peptidase M28 [Blastocatellia bacterium]
MLSQNGIAEGSEKIDVEANARIRKEGMERSQILRTLHFLTDVYGPRLTGSPNHKAAAEWAIKQMQSWGFENAHLEPWDFGHTGWANERASGFLISPVKDNLTFEVLAWTPSTKGTVTAQAVQLILPDRPTKEELSAFFNVMKDKVKGKIVLLGQPQFVPVTLTPPSRRLADETAKERFNPNSVPVPRRSPSQQQQ